MPTIDFGFGYPGTPSLAAALAAAAPGDTIVSYGDTPFYLDPTPSTTWLGAKTGITWNHAGGGDYIFDGGLATNDGLRIDGTGNTLNLRNVDGTRVKWTGFGRYIFWVNGANNVVNDPYLYDNGYTYVAAPNAHCYNYMLYANSTINRPVVASGLDNGSRQYGLFISGSNGGIVTDLLVDGLIVTGASSRAYGISASGACGSVLVDGLTMTNSSAGGVAFGIVWAGTGATDVMAVRKARITGLTGTATYPIYVDGKGIDLENFVIENCSGTGVTMLAAATFAGNTNRLANGVIYGSVNDGISVLLNVAGSEPIIRNVIVRNCPGVGFRSTGTFDPDSDYNLAYNNGTDYNGWTIGANDWTGVDPLHTDAPGGDFRLLAASPCRDAGVAVTGRDFDIAGISVPQALAPDRGPYEYPRPLVSVLGAHFTNGGTGLVAHFVDSTDELITTPATELRFIEDAFTDLALAQGTLGTVAAASAVLTDASGVFRSEHAARALYVYGSEAANAGFRIISSVENSSSITTASNFSADMFSGALLWAIFPSWCLEALRYLGDLSATGGKLVVVYPPVGLAAGTYYLKMENPGGEVFTYREATITI